MHRIHNVLCCYRALKDANVRDAGPGYSKVIYLALKETAGDIHVDGYTGEYGDDDTSSAESDGDTSASYVPPKPPMPGQARGPSCADSAKVQCYTISLCSCKATDHFQYSDPSRKHPGALPITDPESQVFHKRRTGYRCYTGIRQR